jgi:phage-related protein|nr:MAG TPA: distal tail protein [Caudoviricetes sp.]
MEQHYLIFKGINTLTDLKLHIDELPIVGSFEEDKELIEITGRDGYLTYDYNSRKYQTIDVKISARNTEKLDEIKKLFCGSGQLILSSDETRYYKATVINKIDFDRLLRYYNEFIVTFAIQPFSYELRNEIEDITTTRQFNNPTNATCQPIITVYKQNNTNGVGNIYIGNETIQIKAIDEYIELDFALQEAYTIKNGVIKSCNSDVLCDYVEIEPGDTIIDFDGDILRIKILPNYRWL